MPLNNKLPKVSIVIVVRNAADKIEQAIKSVLVQDYFNFEIIILDGASTDGTIEIIQKYRADIAFFSTEKDNGIYDAMNKAIDKCSGDWIYFLGADDELYDPGVLSAIFKEQQNKEEVIFGNAYYLNRKTIRFGNMGRYSLSKHNFNHQTIFYPLSVFKKYRYETKYKIWADYFLNIQLYFKSSYTFKYLNVIVSRFNDMGTSGIHTIDLAFEEDRAKIIKEIFPWDVYIFFHLRKAFLWLQKLFRKKSK